ncbi:zinc finger protein STOP1-like protein [Pyrus ussuriensis x Pyrus communis]|uniref:Zinc finger protein STOP1-like protein n=1 Tax=Pyrus ussuriensis x Pyrus communis TaxID=2448454 RepID=A0A5N5FZQ2_9ROSA|nr:zinc finger protein STOP1-like protein [Pyrus ussuriensis x Pyrus communis]
MMSGAPSNCFQTMLQQQQHHLGLQIYEDSDQVSSFSLEPNSSSSSVPDNHSTSLLCNVSVLKEKVHQAKSLVSILISPNHHQSQPQESATITLASMSNIIQEIIVTASSMMFTCQQMALVSTTTPGNHINNTNTSTTTTGQGLSNPSDHRDHNRLSETNFGGGHGNKIDQSDFYSTREHTLDWFSDSYNDCTTADTSTRIVNQRDNNDKHVQGKELPVSSNYDIIEVDASDLLAKYTHYCQVCGKGFKRDANLRMHMRAHGDEYKTIVALSNPMKKTNNNNDSAGGIDGNMACSTKLPRKYSCPQEGCRWNQKHAKFQPLKSMICVKNHYKRSHCPKMYVCKRCNRKQFSVLSDLRTHEKHCGDLRWQCSCGTTFSRKDKLMGHVALFTGHTPVMITSLTRIGKVDQQSHGSQMQMG